MGSGMLYILRHGATGANADDTFRGLRQIPLNTEGRKQAKAAGEFLKGRKITKICSSDLNRAKETAEIVGRILDAKVTIDKRLRAWDVGAFAGKSRKNHQKAFDYYVEHPNVEVPLGISRQQFVKKLKSIFEEYRSEPGWLFVTSSSCCLEFEKLAENKDPFGKPEQAIPPGGVLAIHGDVAEEIFGDVIKPANFGS